MEGKYYKTKESVEEYIKAAEGFDGMQLVEKLKQVLDSNSTLLELGSGPGTDWEILKESYTVVGSDNSPEFLKHLRTENPNGEFLALDAATLVTDKKFDGIYSNKVLHHLKDNELLASFKRQYEILSPKGIICHSFWKGEGTEIFKGLFVNYHDEGSLEEFYKNYFELLSIESYKEFEEGDSLLLIGRKK
ncbi:MAG: class I SAM-dependent methyltransferase [Aureispira sp.]|nr:class I SAM-dependent methyltransferase [Aureispira sp.]